MPSPGLLKEKVDFMTCCPPLIRIPMVRHILYFPLLLVLQLCRAVLHSTQLALFSPAFYLGICFREGSVSPFALGLSGWFLLILHISPWWPPPLWHPRVPLNALPIFSSTVWLVSRDLVVCLLDSQSALQPRWWAVGEHGVRYLLSWIAQHLPWKVLGACLH